LIFTHIPKTGITLLQELLVNACRTQNNGRSTDNDRPKMPLDWSLFYLTGHFDQPHFHAFQFFQCDCRRLELKHETMMYRNKFIIVCFTVSVSVSNINDRSKTDFERAKIKLTGHFDRRLYISRYFWALAWQLRSSVVRALHQLASVNHNYKLIHVWIFGCAGYDKMHLKYFFCTSLDSNWILKYYLKHEQQCFIRYKDTRRSRVSLGLIKHALRINILNCFKNDRSSKFIGEVIFKKYVV
jgi:hypothetical protein